MSAKSGNSGRNQGNGLCFKDIREKSGNSAIAVDDQGISGKVFVFVSSINRSPNMLESAQEDILCP